MLASKLLAKKHTAWPQLLEPPGRLDPIGAVHRVGGMVKWHDLHGSRVLLLPDGAYTGTMALALALSGIPKEVVLLLPPPLASLATQTEAEFNTALAASATASTASPLRISAPQTGIPDEEAKASSAGLIAMPASLRHGFDIVLGPATKGGLQGATGAMRGAGAGHRIGTKS